MFWAGQEAATGAVEPGWGNGIWLMSDGVMRASRKESTESELPSE